MSTPYDHLHADSFWRTGVAERATKAWEGLYRPKFDITRQTALATAGSCFAQNLRDALDRRSYKVVDTEPAPPGLNGPTGKRFGFGQFSARFGNIYTVRQLRDLLREVDDRHPAEPPIWEKDGRFFDALRPSVEPHGHHDRASVIRHREQHLACVRSMIQQAEVFVFTLGLTEAWIDRRSGRVLPSAPGVLAGTYEPDAYVFKNFSPAEVADDLETVRDLLRSRNKSINLLLTVSPVPLTATAGSQHIVLANAYSKAVLPGAAGFIADKYGDVDYFPSYEVITDCFSGEDFYEKNRRSVTAAGVACVMELFFNAVEKRTGMDGRPDELRGHHPSPAQVQCEDALLDAFAP